jgi:glycosyltransferase involved in cell wall biosynthesis
MKRLKVLIWHVHGSYLYYLTQAPHDFYLPSRPDRKGDYIGRFGHLPWGSNVHDVPAEKVKDLDLDCIIFQLPNQYLIEQHVILSEEQKRLPKIYLQHDPPPDNPTDTKHWVDDPEVLIAHVTQYNRLMWDSNRCPTTVIEHGVIIPEGVQYTGILDKGIVVINHLSQRGRKLGKDIYESVLSEIPLDLVGMGAEEMPEGLGEVLHRDLPAFEAQYRFFFNPIRYSSFPLSMCEAMMVGLPFVGLATTEMPMAITNDVNGYVDTNVDQLIQYMKVLLKDPKKAKYLGDNARRYAQDRFSIHRFVNDWNKALAFATGSSISSSFQTTGG